MVHGMVGHATILAFLIRYGRPQIGEPLSDAFCRFAASKAWKACCDRFPESKRAGSMRRVIEGDGDEVLFEPYDGHTVFSVGRYLRHVLISTFLGKDEKDKLNRVFRSAPPWLIWFTFADYTAALLELDLPDLSSVVGFERSLVGFHHWWGYPSTAFELRPWPHGPFGQTLARTDLRLLQLETDPNAGLSNRVRKRRLAISSQLDLDGKIRWPTLFEAEWLQMDFQTKRAQLAERGDLRVIEHLIHPDFPTLHPNPNRRRRLAPP
jgi:hypothetical protein